ncbi:flavodoxin [Variovorax sp. Sphag1AA]|uniref:flavodoxin n=1 Tax=Variovorax sp. Sphag1AA TaxID=2587027 RepID=UPI0016076788|nr:flavodoxin [Variovorax sp. Sphag1AA]MBB3176798.1 flavodoxin [Variovorax sp. Sphag1AA]
MDKTLVVFYSYSGVCRRVAQLLASHHGWPIGEIRDSHPRAGFMGGLRCVLDSMLRLRPAIRYEGPEPADFDAVVIISPIWAYQMAGPMRTFLAHNAKRLPRVAQITTMNGAGASNAVAEAARLLKSAPILTAEFLVREIEDGSGTSRLLAFGDALKSASVDQSRGHRALTEADIALSRQ